METRSTIPPSGDVTRIVLLGLLAQRPLHGYAVHRVIEERRMDQWADIKPASIYAALQRLEREGLVEATGETRSGRRPVATVYRTTASGLDELRRLLRQAWMQPVRWAAPVDVALGFHQLLDADEIVRLLEARLSALDDLMAHAELVTGSFAVRADDEQLPDGVRAKVADIMEHQRRLLALEHDWTEMVLRHAREGAYAIDPEQSQRFYEATAARLGDPTAHAPLASPVRGEYALANDERD
jgi:DNA-binding PadR family transcriptional regulator